MSLRVDQLGKPLKVIKRIQETSDAVSLVLEIPPAVASQFNYKAGQFVTFFLNIKGEQLNRSYSLSTSPLTDKEFKVTIKKVHGGRASTHLCEVVKEGDTLMTAPPAGLFFRPPPPEAAKGVHYFLIAAGSGITPVFSIMKTVLTASPSNHVTLVYCNRSQDSIIYREELDRWAREHATRLDVVHILTKPQDGWTGHTGRINRTLLAELMEMHVHEKTREFYLCGPTEFMTTVRNSLLELGVNREHLREEDFAISLHKPGVTVNDTWTFIGDDTPAESPEKIIAVMNGETVEVEAKQGQNVLETLLEAGAQPPYSCMDGSCMACMAKVQEGRVYQEDPGILSDDNIDNKECLTCQAKPLSRILKISYDSF